MGRTIFIHLHSDPIRPRVSWHYDTFPNLSRLVTPLRSGPYYFACQYFEFQTLFHLWGSRNWVAMVHFRVDMQFPALIPLTSYMRVLCIHPTEKEHRHGDSGTRQSIPVELRSPLPLAGLIYLLLSFSIIPRLSLPTSQQGTYNQRCGHAFFSRSQPCSFPPSSYMHKVHPK